MLMLEVCLFRISRVVGQHENKLIDNKIELFLVYHSSSVRAHNFKFIGAVKSVFLLHVIQS